MLAVLCRQGLPVRRAVALALRARRCCTPGSVQVKNKYLKESKINAKRMAAAMSGGAPNIGALQDDATMLKSEPDAGAGGAPSGSAAAGAGAAGAKEGAAASGEDEMDDEGYFPGTAVDPSLANYLY
jgi:hypothetical protein